MNDRSQNYRDGQRTNGAQRSVAEQTTELLDHADVLFDRRVESRLEEVAVLPFGGDGQDLLRIRLSQGLASNYRRLLGQCDR